HSMPVSVMLEEVVDPRFFQQTVDEVPLCFVVLNAEGPLRIALPQVPLGVRAFQLDVRKYLLHYLGNCQFLKDSTAMSIREQIGTRTQRGWVAGRFRQVSEGA